MPSKKVNKKKIQKTWKDIANLRESKEIKLDDEVIFTIQELSSQEIDDFIENLYSTNELDSENEQLEVELPKSKIGYLLRKMVVGIDFENLDDTEIVDVLEQFSESITIQVNDVLNLFITQKVYNRIKNLSSLVGEMDGLDEAIKKVNAVGLKNKGVVQ